MAEAHTTRMGLRSVLIAAALPAFLAPGEARAETAAGLATAAARPPPKYARTTLEVLGVTATGTVWYWANTDLNQVDWELGWDWPSWRRKLFSLDAIRLDTNEFEFNSINHPLAGALFYQAGRANGFGVWGSLVVDFAATAFWEYFVEFKELVSLNDLVVNTAAGPSIGEPLAQLGRYLHDHGTTWIAHGAAHVLSPFDGLHGWEAHRRSAAPWHRFRFAAGLRAASLGGDASRGEGLFGMDLELVTQPGYGRPGASSGKAAGSWNRLVARLALSQGAPGTPFVGAFVHTRTTLGGFYRRSFDDLGQGTGLFTGVACAFHYETRRLGEELDRVAIAHIAGPMLDLVVRRGAITIRWQLAGFADFDMLQAFAFGPDGPLDKEPPFPSPMRTHGYYFGVGATAETRLVVGGAGWDLELEARAHQAWSLDRWKRTEDGTPDPEDVIDQRAAAGAAFTVHLGEDLGLSAVVEGTGRRGTWQAIDRRSLEVTGTLQVVKGL